MQLDRVRKGEAAAGLGALLIVVSLLLPWIEPATIEVDGLGSGYVAFAVEGSRSGFSGAGLVFVVALLVVAILAATLVVLTVSVEPVGATVSAAVLLAFGGLLVTIAVLVRLVIAQPDFGVGLPDAAVDLRVGAYLSLLGVVLATAGGWLTLRDERTDAPYSAAPDVPARPAPPR